LKPVPNYNTSEAAKCTTHNKLQICCTMTVNKLIYKQMNYHFAFVLYKNAHTVSI